MELKIIASSSSGNCALLRVGEKNFLIDAGLPMKKLSAALEAEGLSASNISAIFVTHEHSDHVAGLGGFGGLGIPVYATRGTAEATPVRKEIAWQIIPADSKFAIGGLMIESFSIPHDACEPVGYVFEEEDERLVWALDIGHLDSRLKTIFKSATTLVLESNYCPQLLEADKKRPWSLKQRIRGRHGHLSNDETFEFLTAETSLFWRQIFLAHLSRHCNDVEMLEARYAMTGLPVQVVDPAGEAVSA